MTDIESILLPDQAEPETTAGSAGFLSKPHPICLASCFLPLDEGNSRWWRRLQDELAGHGVELVLLSSGPAADPGLRVILVPLWLQGYGLAYFPPAAPVTLEAPLAWALAERDRAWTMQEQRDFSEFSNGLNACQQVLRKVLDELQPAIVLAWGTSLPQSVVLQQLAVQKGLPCWAIERGLLPGTLMIEMAGQGAQSELNWSYTLNHVLLQARETDLFFAAQAAYRQHTEDKYAQAGFVNAETFRTQHNPSGRKLVALLLQHDAASCLVPSDYPGARIHAPAFASSEAAMAALAEAACELNCTVLVKLHPMDARDYSGCETENLRIVREVNLHSLMEAADVVASMTSTTQFEALLCEKPVVLMAHSQLADKGIAYEARTPADLKPALEGALNRTDFPQRLTQARRVITFLLRHFSIAFTDSSVAGSTLAELAAFLARNAPGMVNARSSNDSLAALKQVMDAWTKTKTTT